MCDAPLVRNASVMSRGIELFSPVSKAFISAAVSSCRNGNISIFFCAATQHEFAKEASGPDMSAELNCMRASFEKQKAPVRKVVRAMPHPVTNL